MVNLSIYLLKNDKIFLGGEKMKYHENLKEIREEKGYTQKEVAEAINTTYQYYSAYERGLREVPFSRMIQIANFLKVSLDRIAGR